MPKPRKPLVPLGPESAVLLEALRADSGFDEALRRAGVHERTFFTWLAHARRKGPEGEPYRRFRAAIAETITLESPRAARRGRL
jgi:hypothetical protein